MQTHKEARTYTHTHTHSFSHIHSQTHNLSLSLSLSIYLSPVNRTPTGDCSVVPDGYTVLTDFASRNCHRNWPLRCICLLAGRPHFRWWNKTGSMLIVLLGQEMECVRHKAVWAVGREWPRCSSACACYLPLCLGAHRRH